MVETAHEFGDHCGLRHDTEVLAALDKAKGGK